MKINKAAQYGLLFCMFLSSRGRVRLKDAAGSLGVPVFFLEQIAVKLKSAGYVTSYKGPGGGYELSDTTTFANILDALGSNPWIATEDELASIWKESHTGEILARFILTLVNSYAKIMETRIKDYVIIETNKNAKDQSA